MDGIGDKGSLAVLPAALPGRFAFSPTSQASTFLL